PSTTRGLRWASSPCGCRRSTAAPRSASGRSASAWSTPDAVPSILHADDVGRVLLVRAVEERDPEAVPPVARGDAAVDAGAIEPPETWLARRAALLLPHLLPPYPALPTLLARAARTLLRVVIGGAFLIGLAANYLGPSEHIHLLYNPLVALILWNLGVYVVVAA